jgi:hypothetical protein
VWITLTRWAPNARTERPQCTLWQPTIAPRTNRVDGHGREIADLPIRAPRSFEREHRPDLIK